MKRQPTIQDVTWFLDLHKMGKLDLDPPYQRRSVWTLKDRRYFLDSVFRNYPCPPVFLHKELDDSGAATYHVVDGKQRLQSIIDFTNNSFSLDKKYGDSNLDGKTWEEIPTEYKRRLWDYAISVEYINDINDTATVNEVFDRVNRNQKKLDRQELRHAKYNGWFVSTAEAETDEEFWKVLGISTTARARRMKDIQFVSELMLVTIENKVRGFDQDILDTKYADYDDPDSAPLGFDKDDFNQRTYHTKQLIEAIERKNGAVTKYAKSLNHFYTLWSIVVIHGSELELDSFAEKYAEFMEKVRLHTKEGDGERDENVTNYAINSTGASTDLKQRSQRLKALEAAIL